MKRSGDERGFTFAELLISMVGSVLIIGALMLGSIGFQKSFHASEVYSNSQLDQRRLIDYLARDLRRAIGISMTASNDTPPIKIGADSLVVEDRSSLVLTLPAYYKSNVPSEADFDQPLPVVTSGDQVAYGTKTGPSPSFPVVFRRVFVAAEKCVCFVRQEDESEKIILRNAEDMHMQITFVPDGKSCEIEVWFRSPYSVAHPLIATHDQVMLRNLRTD